jgi:FAD/FMN-containing dehydrogenase
VGDSQTIVRKAAAERKSIRVAGGGGGKSGAASYSVSAVVKNEGGIIVKLQGMSGGHAHKDGSGRLTVQAGMTIAELTGRAQSSELRGR